jgi:cyclopropane-fatty-acyl-phospholipid synthase
MASRKQVGEVYDYIDGIWRTAFGENADCSNALYGGDCSKTLEEAQRDKHAYILDGIKFVPPAHVLDIGCGWGAMLRVLHEAGGRVVGLTVSLKQAEVCRRSGFKTHVLDWRDADAASLGRFDSVLCIGALEHFCSADEYLAGQQDAIYDRFFRLCRDLLAERGRLYLQTVLWGQSVPPYSRVSVRAPFGSDEYLLAAFETLFRDSCLPFSVEQIERIGDPYFRLVSRMNGREDYILTIEAWCRRLWRLKPSTLPVFLKMGIRALTHRDFRYQFESARRAYWAECFRRQLMDHERIVFERK